MGSSRRCHDRQDEPVHGERNDEDVLSGRLAEMSRGKLQLLDVNTPVCFNVVSSLDRSRTRAAATSRDGHCPSPADNARTMVPVPEVLGHGCCTSCRHLVATAIGDEGFASSSSWWAVGNHKKRDSGADGGPFRAFRLCSCSCGCGCANLVVDILASGPLDRLSAPFAVDHPCSMSYPNHVYCGTAYHVRTGARRSCRLQIENTSVYVEAVDSHNSMRGGCAPTRTFPPLRGSRPSPPLELNGAGPQGAHKLRAGTGKIPPEESGGHHAVYPESGLQAVPVVRCINMELALGLTSRLDIGVTMPPCHQERTCKRNVLGDNAAHYLPVNRQQSSNAVLCLHSQQSESTLSDNGLHGKQLGQAAY
ncbi:hypothetical protein LA080_011130 [Diaporthe eres]|nr:hypothetical protein LA080_011130 [Diaporthe eres]